MAESATSDPHWTVKCDTCSEPVEYFCNTCGERMCSSSREYHLKSRASSDHDVVMFSDNAELLMKSLYKTYCEDHPSQKYQLWCESCKKAVCVKCTTHNHNTHRFLELNKIYETRRKVLVDALHILRTEVSPKWKKRHMEIGDSIREYQRNIQNLDKELVQEGEKMKSRIDKIVAGRREELQHERLLVVKDLNHEEDSCQKEIPNVENLIAQFEDCLRHENQMNIIHFDLSRTDYPRLRNVGEFPQPYVPQLTGTEFKNAEFEERFLILDNCNREFSKETIMRNEAAVQMEAYQRGPSPAQMTVPTQGITEDTELLGEHVLINNVKTTASSPSVGCLLKQRAWVETKPNLTSMIDIQGEIFHSVKIPPSSFTVSSKEHLVTISYDEKLVTEITKADKRKPLFTLPYRATGICSTTEKIVIAFHEAHETVVYDWKGGTIAKYTSVRYPYKVTVNEVTHDLCICSKSDLSEPGCIGRVVALMRSGETHYEYKGPDPEHFSPVELCSDPGGRVLVADCGSSSVHIIARDGRFLTYLLIHPEKFDIPMTIDCDREGHVWIGEMNGTIKIVKYLSL